MFIYLVILAVTLFCLNRWKMYQKYYNQGLNGPLVLPILGNSLHIMLRPFKSYEESNFKKYGHTYVDFVLDNKGVIVTSNTEYVKRILINDFQYFSHRLQPTYTPKYARTSVIFQDEDWKRIRTQVTPVFSSGKLKTMFKNFDGPVKTTIDNIADMIDSGDSQHVDIKKLMKAFSLDMIGHVVFSLKTNAYKEDDLFAKKVTELFKVRRFFIVPLLFFMPKFMLRALKITFIREDTVEYFSKMTLGLIEERKKNKDKKYNDFIDLLLKSEAEESKIEKSYEEDGHIVKKLTTEEIVGQCFIFFVAGLETISTALSLVLYEMAINTEMQLRLFKELRELYPTDEISYEDVNKSKYLDAVINETLRRHTTLARIFRKATANYDFGEFKVEKGQTMAISLHNLHHDPKIYESPEEFNPDRFITGELAKGTNTFRPIPFVDGPRNCIGNRFALLEMKSLLIPLFKSIEYSVLQKLKCH